MSEIDLVTPHEAIADALVGEPCVIADRTLSWGEVTDRTRRLAAVLRAHGLGRRRPDRSTPSWETGQDHLGLYLHNGIPYLEGLLGAHKASVAPFNVNYRYGGEELAYLLHDARTDAMVYGARFAPLLEEASGTSASSVSRAASSFASGRSSTPPVMASKITW
jgi:acyl-CoA synthetase (AMP-forming)/AMP-acid ligase II